MFSDVASKPDTDTLLIGTPKVPCHAYYISEKHKRTIKTANYT